MVKDLSKTVNSEWKNGLEPFSKELKVVLLYSIKTVVSHLKSRQSYSNGQLPYYGSFHYLARALLHDVGCEFACAVRMRRNN